MNFMKNDMDYATNDLKWSKMIWNDLQMIYNWAMQKSMNFLDWTMRFNA